MAAAETQQIAVEPSGGIGLAERRRAVRQAWILNIATIGWNTVEGVVALAAGIVAGSVSLVGFGLDSVIEVSAALILTWRLRQERKQGCTQSADVRATKAIAISFAALAAFVAFDAIGDLAARSEPEASTVGLVLAAVSLAVMPVLARAKARLAPKLGSAAARADASQTNLCALLSAVLLVGIGANWAFHWWWADPLAGLAIAAIAATEAVRTWRADSLADTCCNGTP